jgi:hypothetical protein
MISAISYIERDTDASEANIDIDFQKGTIN